MANAKGKRGAAVRSLSRMVLTLAIGIGAAVSLRGEIIDRILAVVGGQTVTLSDVRAALQFGLVTPSTASDDPLGSALDRLIDRTLMLGEVDRFQPPEPDPVEITIRVDDLERRAGSPAAFATSLAVTGTTREQLRRHIRDDLRMATYLNQRFGVNTAPAARAAAIAVWIAELRRRAEITVQYQKKPA